MAEISIQELAETLMNLTTKQHIQLKKELEEVHGLEMNLPQTISTPIKEEVVKEEPKKTTFNVTLKSSGEKHLSVVKTWKQYNEGQNMSLKEAKEIIDSAPVILKESVSQIEAEEIKKLLEEVSNGVEIIIG